MRLYYYAGWQGVRIISRLFGGWHVDGEENVPRHGGVLVASNHISLWDPPMVGAAFPREAFFLAKEELFEKPFLGLVLRSVNVMPIRRGVADLRGIARALDVLRKGEILVMFPEGGRVRDGELHAARPGLGMIAVHADAPIVPCYISGSNRQREWLSRRARVRITIGPCRPWSEFAGEAAGGPHGRPLYQAIGDGVMREITRLKQKQMQESAAGGPAQQRPA